MTPALSGAARVWDLTAKIRLPGWGPTALCAAAGVLLITVVESASADRPDGIATGAHCVAWNELLAREGA